VIVGLGAAGGIAAHVLTEAGLDVVALDAGPRIDVTALSFDELRNDIHNWMAEPKAKSETPTWRSSEDQVARPSPWPILMANAVGGSTMHYEGVSLRFQPWNFATRSETIARYGAGALPSNSTVADWPLSYAELSPYYDLAEDAVGVSGQAGRVQGRIDPRGNYFEVDRGRDYPMPPLRRTGWTKMMSDAAARLKWHPFAAPAAINSMEFNGRAACTYCGFCHCNACHVDAKGTVTTTVLPRAEATGRLRIEPSARVVEIEVDRRGRATGVRYIQDGRDQVQHARVVLVGGYVYENARLLLLSTSKAFPTGLANNHGQVGRHFMTHVCPGAFGLFPGRRLNLFSGTMAQVTAIDDWNCDNFDHAGLGFIGGGMLACWPEFKPIATASGAAVPSHVPRWGAAWKRWLRDNAQSVGFASAQFDALTYEHNYLDLDPVGRDAIGLPVVRVTHDVHANERNGGEFLTHRLREWLHEAGASETWGSGHKIEGRHAAGGTRMGDDPATSVVDRYCFCHEVPNVGVLGASTFPTVGGHNPTLTVQAMAWWTAQHLLDSWSERSGATA
jgi:gluconate 2-dehydrogenase alpha chain